MPFMPSDQVLYVPNQMRQQGQTIADDAQQLASDTKTFWQHFQQAYQSMPQAVQTHLKTFEDNNQSRIDQLTTQRMTIGHLLSGSASQVEQEDGQMQYLFYENIPLNILTQ